MKKPLLLIGTTFITEIYIAQQKLTSTNSNPAIGDVFTIKAGSWINEGGSGASQTWNFTSVTQSTAAATAYTVSTVSSSLTAQYPNANVEQKGSGNSGLLKTSSTALQNYGITSGTVL